MYLLYQFNLGEIQSAINYCSHRRIGINITIAHMIDYYLREAFLDHSLSEAKLRLLSRDLFLYYVDDLIASMPSDYVCPQQQNYLNIDEFCQVVTCCSLSKNHPDYSPGNLFELSSEDIYASKVSQNVCKKCIRSGSAYWAMNPISPRFVNDMKRNQQAMEMINFFRDMTPPSLKLLFKKINIIPYH